MEIYCKTCDKVLGHYPDEKIPPNVKGHTTCNLCGSRIEIFRKAEDASTKNITTAPEAPVDDSNVIDDIAQTIPLLSGRKDRGVKKGDLIAIALGFLIFISIVVVYKPDFDPARLLPPGFQQAMSATHVEAGEYEVKRSPDELPISRKPIKTISIDEIVALREMLKEKRYEELNITLGKYQQAFEKDPTDEYKVNDAYRAFCNLDPSYEVFFEEWKSRFPDDYQPYLAIAGYYYERGWESRGSAWIKYTSEEQLEGMRSYFSKALENIDSSLAIRSDLLPAYDILIGISNASSLGGNKDEVIERAIKRFPHSFLIRITAFWAKDSKWGGSNYERVKIAEDAEKYAHINPKLSSLYGSIYVIQGNALKSNDKYDEARRLFQKALNYGAQGNIYQGLAEINFYHDSDYDAALENINRSINLYPVEEDYYLFRSKILFKTGEDDKALKDIYRAMRINPLAKIDHSDHMITAKNLEMLFALNGKGLEVQERGVNWLYNPSAEERMKGWRTSNDKGRANYRKGNPCFTIHDGGQLQQNVYIPEAPGWYALFVARASVNKKRKELTKSGIPYIEFFMGYKSYIKQQSKDRQLGRLHFSNTYNDDWVPMWGIWEIPHSVNRISFLMKQSKFNDPPIGHTEARFDDLGLYFFESEEEAEEFLESHFKKLDMSLPSRDVNKKKATPKIWRKPGTEKEQFSSMPFKTAIDTTVAYYPFNGNANDFSGLYNHGTVHGATLTTDRFGKANRAYSFDGEDDYIDFANDVSVNLTDQLSMVTWINAESLASGRIISKWGYKSGYGLGVYESKLSFSLNQCGAVQTSLEGRENQWTFVAATWDGRHAKLYVNGVEMASVDSYKSFIGDCLPLVKSPYNLLVGEVSHKAPNSKFKGKIDDVRIFNYVLSGSEVQALYTETESMNSTLKNSNANRLSSGTIKYNLPNCSGGEWFGGGKSPRNVGTGQGFVPDQTLTNVHVSMPFTYYDPSFKNQSVTLVLRDSHGKILERGQLISKHIKGGDNWKTFRLKQKLHKDKKYIFTWWLQDGYMTGIHASSPVMLDSTSSLWDEGYSGVSKNGSDLSDWPYWSEHSSNFCIKIEGDKIGPLSESPPEPSPYKNKIPGTLYLNSKTSGILIRTTNDSVFQLNMGRRVFAYKNNGWKVSKINADIYYVKFEKWKNTFWKVDLKSKEVFSVKGGEFGNPGGKEQRLRHLKIKIDKRDNYFIIKTNSASMEIMPDAEKVRLFWDQDLIIDEQYFDIKKITKNIVHFRIKDRKNFFYKLDIPYKQLYSISNGKFGETGGNETLIASVDVT